MSFVYCCHIFYHIFFCGMVQVGCFLSFIKFFVILVFAVFYSLILICLFLSCNHCFLHFHHPFLFHGETLSYIVFLSEELFLISGRIHLEKDQVTPMKKNIHAHKFLAVYLIHYHSLQHMTH